MSQTALVALAFEAFASDLARPPRISLRAGNDLDNYKAPAAFDTLIDQVSDGYLERYAWGVNHLDAASWRHYLPHLVEYALRHMKQGSLVTDALLTSLRPPDHNPPRLGSLTRSQEALLAQVLDTLAFSDGSANQDLACQAIEEWWAPGALYRRPSDAI